jgi:hypothetical protein
MTKSILDVFSLEEELSYFVKPDGSVDVNGAREFLEKYSRVVVRGIHPDKPDFRTPAFESMTRDLIVGMDELKKMSDSNLKKMVLSYLETGESLNQSFDKIQELERELNNLRRTTRCSSSESYQPETMTPERTFSWKKSLGIAAAVVLVGTAAYFAPKIIGSQEERFSYTGGIIMEEIKRYNLENNVVFNNPANSEDATANNQREHSRDAKKEETKKAEKYGPN